VIRKIVLVTAKESAALHDMLKIIEKRWPLVEVMIVDTLVQGESAAIQIAQSLRFADRLNADVVIVGRGGGSTEDLWAFNEEAVADAIFAMRTPVVSAVGHEVDVLISDHVADLRAPTPSAAIEMVLPDKNDLLFMLDEWMERYDRLIKQKIMQKEQQIMHLLALLHQNSPQRKLQEMSIAFGRLREEFNRTIGYKLEQFSAQLLPLQLQLKQNIQFVITQKSKEVEHLNEKIKMSNPRLQCKSGWVQLSKNKKPITLKEIAVDETFLLADGDVKMEARCLSKKEI